MAYFLIALFLLLYKPAENGPHSDLWDEVGEKFVFRFVFVPQRTFFFEIYILAWWIDILEWILINFTPTGSKHKPELHILEQHVINRDI